MFLKDTFRYLTAYPYSCILWYSFNLCMTSISVVKRICDILPNTCVWDCKTCRHKIQQSGATHGRKIRQQNKTHTKLLCIPSKDAFVFSTHVLMLSNHPSNGPFTIECTILTRNTGFTLRYSFG